MNQGADTGNENEERHAQGINHKAKIRAKNRGDNPCKEGAGCVARGIMLKKTRNKQLNDARETACTA